MSGAKQIQDRKVLKPVMFDLSDKELIGKGERLASLQIQEGDLLKEFDNVKKNYQARLKALSTEKTMTIEVIGEKKEERTVDCVERFDYENQKVITLIGKKVLEERKMTGNEFQTFMNLQVKKAKPSKKVKPISDAQAKKKEQEHHKVKNITREMTNTKSALNA